MSCSFLLFYYSALNELLAAVCHLTPGSVSHIKMWAAAALFSSQRSVAVFSPFLRTRHSGSGARPSLSPFWLGVGVAALLAAPVMTKKSVPRVMRAEPALMAEIALWVGPPSTHRPPGYLCGCRLIHSSLIIEENKVSVALCHTHARTRTPQAALKVSIIFFYYKDSVVLH